MPSFFTHYWAGSTCRDGENRGDAGQPLDHTAGELFTRRGVKVGDRVYVVTIVGGRLYVVGRMTVGVILLSNALASQRLGYEVWDASEHLLARKGASTTRDFDRRVPYSIAARLRFHGRAGDTRLTFVAKGRLDGQTLRGVRRLTSASARLLDRIIERSGRCQVEYLAKRRDPSDPTTSWNQVIADAGQPGDEPAAAAVRRRSKAALRETMTKRR